MSMITGRRRPCLVVFQSFSTVDGQFGLTKTWSEFCRAWVNIEPERGREQVYANERESVATHVVRGDYLDLLNVTAQMRMVYHPDMAYGTIPAGSEVYEILAVMPTLNDKTDTVIRVEKEGRTYGQISG
jgi:head-tail adaptor